MCLQNFLDNFQAAQKSLVTASTAAAGAAKLNVVEAYENAARVSMNIKVKAPIIIVPIKSDAYHGLCLDLGYIRASNHLVDIKTEAQKAVIDEIKLDLYEIRLFKINLIPESLAKGEEKFY